MNGRMSRILEHDVYLFKQGKHYHLFEKLGSYITAYAGVSGAHFNLWAPRANAIAVIGDFNQWDATRHQMHKRNDGSGIWEIFIAGVDLGASYKYRITLAGGEQVDKVDPFAYLYDCAPLTAAKVWNLDYQWSDLQWMKTREKNNTLNAPMAIYELHLGSWHCTASARDNIPSPHQRALTYLELADWLPAYLNDLGFTHVEFLPLAEYSDYHSWGFQTTGYFAPTARYGTPQELMYLIDRLHQQGIGIILDWVPSHFSNAELGLHRFDGTPLFEHSDRQQGFESTEHGYKFNYRRFEVCSFLISSALFWLEKYHVDGLRVIGVRSMISLDHQQREGKRAVNKFGGHEDLEAIEFLKKLNNVVVELFPAAKTIADESTRWPTAVKPSYLGGLGFAMAWHQDWYQDTIKFFAQHPQDRKYHLVRLTFSLYHELSEHYILPLSHQNIFLEKKSLIEHMPGDDWQKFANLRLLYGYVYGHPGKKLLFMGSELGPQEMWHPILGVTELNENKFGESEIGGRTLGLDREQVKTDEHQGLQYWLHDLNQLYRSEPALFKFFETDKYFEAEIKEKNFEGIHRKDMPRTVISFMRRAENPLDNISIVCNFTAEQQTNYQLAVPLAGRWQELLNSDLEVYGGSGCRNLEALQTGHQTEPQEHDIYPYSLTLTLPPLAILFLKLN